MPPLDKPNKRLIYIASVANINKQARIAITVETEETEKGYEIREMNGWIERSNEERQKEE